MRKLIFNFTLPLTIVSFICVTQWWYGLVIDAWDVFLYGFPLIYKTQGFHTSMSTQYFLMEMIIDFLVYFGFWLVITLIVKRFWTVEMPKIIARAFWLSFALLFIGFVYLSREMDDVWYIKRHIEVEVIDSGLDFFHNPIKAREKYADQLKQLLQK